MKIVLASDTHGNVSFVQKIIKDFPNAARYLHAGDSAVYESQIDPFITVKGNCDYYVSKHFRIVEVGDLRVYVFHGEYYPLGNSGLYQLANLAKENNCNIIVHGHTHIPRHDFVDGVHIICPGSPIFPRGGMPTFAVIEFNNFNDLQVRFMEYGN